MSDILVSRRYARALMQATREQEMLDSVQEDVEYLLQLSKTSEEFQTLLTDPMIRPRHKQDMFDTLFSERLTPITLSFLNLLAEKQRESLLEECLTVFQEVLDEAAGTVTAHVTTVAPLSRSQRRALQEKLEQFSGRSIRFEEDCDPGIMGGLVVRIKDTVLDGSVATQLRQLREHLAKG